MKRFSYFALVLTAFFPMCSAPDQADLLVHNVKGYTLQGDSLVQFSTLAVKNGKVLATGGDELLEQLSAREQLDGAGKTLLPGLTDAHGHVMSLGYLAAQVNLEGTRSLEEALDRVKTYADENPDVPWILGRGWNQVLWEVNAFPTAADLDSISDGRPVYLPRIDGHAAWVNSAAMSLAGVSRETIDPPGGKVLRDGRGNATGVLVDAAMDIVSQHIPDASAEEHRTALEKALEQLARLGVTSTHDAGIGYDEYRLFRDFADRKVLTTRIYAMVAGVGNDFDRIAAEGMLSNYLDDYLAVRSVKLMIDGALGSRGALLAHPYHDDPANSGLAFFDTDSLTMMTMKAASKGYQVNIHAIGDLANTRSLDALANAADSLPGSKDLRHRIEHAQIVNPADFRRFADLQVIASVQPVHATSDMNMAEHRVGSERIQGSYAWRTFLEHGVVLASGSDYPVENANPFHGLYAAVTRSDTLGNPPGGWYADQKLSRLEAFRSFTLDAAYAAHQERVLGSLEAGKWADFIIVDRDYFTVPESEIWKTRVKATYVAGKPVFVAE